MIKWIKYKIIWFLFGGVALASTGGTAIVDNQINPYTDKIDRMEIIVLESSSEKGEQKVELKKDKPEFRFKKWNSEVDLGLTYEAIKSKGSRKLLTNKFEYKDKKQEIQAYPLEEGFEIEVILLEKPDTNVVTFKLDNWEDLDFFYQPELTQEEIDEGASRPENVVGSYAVYHKEKANHIIGQINYETGKVGHIYRPKIIDSDGKEIWGDLHIEKGILSVTIPQEFLDKAVYPVRHAAGLTFGYTSICSSQTYYFGTYFLAIRGTTPATTGTMSKIQAAVWDGGGNSNIKLAVYTDKAGPLPDAYVANSGSGAILVTRTTKPTTDAQWTSSTSVSGTLSASTAYWLAISAADNTVYIAYDSTGGEYIRSSGTYANFPTATFPAGDSFDDNISIYATYTAAAEETTANKQDEIWFD